MDTVQLPEPVAAYFATDKAKDVNGQSLLFTENALVYDEDEDYHGRDAIRAWKEEANSEYQYEAQPLDASVEGNVVTVLVRLTGNFPGSPVEIEHTFTLENGEIASLVID